MLAHCHSELGAFADGIVCGEEAMRIAEEANRPLDRVYAYWGTSYLYFRQGELSQAIPVLERGLALCQDGKIGIFSPRFASQLGLAYALSGRFAEALPCLEQTLDPVALGKARQSAFYFLCAGEVYALAGRVDDAIAVAERALTLAQTGKEQGYEAWTLRLLGEIAMRCDPVNMEDAENYYQQALTLATELGMRPLQAHCHLGLGTLYSQIGRVEQARDALITAIDLYRAMEMTFWLPQAEGLLARLR
jgi:tetratricopeptide (TPR) repeat protein